MLVAFFGIANTASITPPSGMTERGEVIGVGAHKIASAGADDRRNAGSILSQTPRRPRRASASVT